VRHLVLLRTTCTVSRPLFVCSLATFKLTACLQLSQAFSGHLSLGMARDLSSAGPDWQFADGSLVRIEVTNFMGIEHYVLNAKPSVNFIVGPNGTGKSSVLYAIAIVFNASLSVWEKKAALVGTATERLASLIRAGTRGFRIRAFVAVPKGTVRVGTDASDHPTVPQRLCDLPARAQAGVYPALGTSYPYLAGFPRGVAVVERVVRAADRGKSPTSSFSFNGVATTGKYIDDWCRRLGIYINNPCMLMPQESADALARQSSPIVLHHLLSAVEGAAKPDGTTRVFPPFTAPEGAAEPAADDSGDVSQDQSTSLPAVGAGQKQRSSDLDAPIAACDLLAGQADLISLRKAHVETQVQEAKLSTELNVLMDEKESLQEQVERARRWASQTYVLEALQLLIAWLKVPPLAKAVDEASAQLADAKVGVSTVRQLVEQAVRALQDADRAKQHAADRLVSVQTVVSTLRQRLEAQQDSISQLAAQLTGQLADVEQAHQRREQLLSRAEQFRIRIAQLEEQDAPSLAAVQAARAECQRVESAFNLAQSEFVIVETQHREAQHSFSRAQSELERLSRQGDSYHQVVLQRAARMARNPRDLSAAAAKLKALAQQNRFRFPVFGPLAAYAQLRDVPELPHSVLVAEGGRPVVLPVVLSWLRYVLSSSAGEQFVSFDTEDDRLVRREVLSRTYIRSSKLPMPTSTALPARNTVQPHVQARFGVVGTAYDLLEAPPLALKALLSELRLDRVLLCNKRLTSEEVDALFNLRGDQVIDTAFPDNARNLYSTSVVASIVDLNTVYLPTRYKNRISVTQSRLATSAYSAFDGVRAALPVDSGVQSQMVDGARHALTTAQASVEQAQNALQLRRGAVQALQGTYSEAQKKQNEAASLRHRLQSDLRVAGSELRQGETELEKLSPQKLQAAVDATNQAIEVRHQSRDRLQSQLTCHLPELATAEAAVATATATAVAARDRVSQEETALSDAETRLASSRDAVQVARAAFEAAERAAVRAGGDAAGRLAPVFAVPQDDAFRVSASVLQLQNCLQSDKLPRSWLAVPPAVPLVPLGRRVSGPRRQARHRFLDEDDEDDESVNLLTPGCADGHNGAGGDAAIDSLALPTRPSPAMQFMETLSQCELLHKQVVGANFASRERAECCAAVLDLTQVKAAVVSVRAQTERLKVAHAALDRFRTLSAEIAALTSTVADHRTREQAERRYLFSARSRWVRGLQAVLDRVNPLFSRALRSFHVNGSLKFVFPSQTTFLVDFRSADAVPEPASDAARADPYLAQLFDFAKYGVDMSTSFRDSHAHLRLSRSGGENSVASLCFVVALHSVGRFPFRVVDEINQGLDDRNERTAHKVMTRVSELALQAAEDAGLHHKAAGAHTGPTQYFIGSPKLPDNLSFHKTFAMVNSIVPRFANENEEAVIMDSPVEVPTNPKSASAFARVAAPSAYESPYGIRGAMVRFDAPTDAGRKRHRSSQQ
jgi:chromosome segregation ATPase